MADNKKPKFKMKTKKGKKLKFWILGRGTARKRPNGTGTKPRGDG